MAGCRPGIVTNMTNPKQDQPAEDTPAVKDKQPPPQGTSPHDKAPPDNPPIDDYDLERGKANLDRVIAK